MTVQLRMLHGRRANANSGRIHCMNVDVGAWSVTASSSGQIVLRRSYRMRCRLDGRRSISYPLQTRVSARLHPRIPAAPASAAGDARTGELTPVPIDHRRRRYIRSALAARARRRLSSVRRMTVSRDP